MLCVFLRSQLPPRSQKYNNPQIQDKNVVNDKDINGLGRPPKRSLINKAVTNSVRARTMPPRIEKRAMRAK